MATDVGKVTDARKTPALSDPTTDGLKGSLRRRSLIALVMIAQRTTKLVAYPARVSNCTLSVSCWAGCANHSRRLSQGKALQTLQRYSTVNVHETVLHYR